MSSNDPERDQQPQPLGPEPTAPISQEAAARAAAEADAARASGADEGKTLADAIDQRMYVGGTEEPTPPLSEEMDTGVAAGDPFRESDEAAAKHPPDVPFPAGNPDTVIDESPETPATVVPPTTGTGSSIAIGCIAAAVVIVLVVILVLTLVS